MAIHMGGHAFKHLVLAFAADIDLIKIDTHHDIETVFNVSGPAGKKKNIILEHN